MSLNKQPAAICVVRGCTLFGGHPAQPTPFPPPGRISVASQQPIADDHLQRFPLAIFLTMSLMSLQPLDDPLNFCRAVLTILAAQFVVAFLSSAIVVNLTVDGRRTRSCPVSAQASTHPPRCPTPTAMANMAVCSPALARVPVQ